MLHLGALRDRILFFHTGPKPTYKHLPRFDCNLNTGEGMTKATNVVYHDKAHPSALILPIVP
jgi:hypothetical protein